MVSLDQAPHSSRPDRAPLPLMNEAFLGREFFVPRSPTFSANASRSNVRTEVLSKIKFNGVGGTQTYLSFTHFRGSILLKTSIGRRGTMNINLKTDVDLA